jgi:hypothetical protein
MPALGGVRHKFTIYESSALDLDGAGSSEVG